MTKLTLEILEMMDGFPFQLLTEDERAAGFISGARLAELQELGSKAQPSGKGDIEASVEYSSSSISDSASEGSETITGAVVETPNNGSSDINPREAQILREAHMIVSQLNFYLDTNKFMKSEPYPISKADVVRYLPKFVYKESFGQLARKHAERVKTHEYFLKLVVSLFRDLHSRSFLSSHKLAATLELHGHKVSHTSVASWLEMLVEQGFLDVNKKEFEKTEGKHHPVSAFRKAFIYTIKHPKLKPWVSSMAISRLKKALEVAADDGDKILQKLAFHISRLLEDERQPAILALPDLDRWDSKHKKTRLQKIESMVEYHLGQQQKGSLSEAPRKKGALILTCSPQFDLESKEMKLAGDDGEQVIMRDSKITVLADGVSDYFHDSDSLGDRSVVLADTNRIVERYGKPKKPTNVMQLRNSKRRSKAA